LRALADPGYESVVVTRGLEERNERWTPEDATLNAEIPAGVEIHRLPSATEPEPTTWWHPFAERWFGVKNRWTRWWASGSFELGRQVGASADLIYVWMQPYASAEPAAALSRALGKPWVADLGDPWALDEMMIYPSALHRRLALRRMGELLGTASAIVMNTPEAAERLLGSFPELRGRPVTTIPNGFDASDFAGDVEPRRDGKFRIVHTGYLHTELAEQHRRRRLVWRALGGGTRGIDILTRSHVFLVDAIDAVLARRPDLANVLELHLAGVTNETDRAVALRCPVAKLHGYVSHARSIELIRTADLLFLPMQNLPPGVRATIVPGKNYEYLASAAPILAAVPDGDARDILVEAGNAILVRPDDVGAMSLAIERELERFRSGAAPSRPEPEVVARFEYQRLAANLANVFDTVLGRRGAIAPPATAVRTS
jgi:glycosyltransferase involved in cell wall biosynthesis